VETPEGTPVGTERRICPLAGVAMDLALAVTVVIACPFAHPVGNRGMARMATSITLPFIGIEPCATGGHVVGDQVVAGLPVRMVADPQALRVRVARDDADDGGTSVGRGAVPFALLGAPAWRVGGIATGRACFPLRSGTARLPQRRWRTSRRSALCRSGWFGCAAAGYGVVCVTGPTRVQGALWARLWRCHAAAGPAWLGVGGSFQKRCGSGAYSSRHTCGNGRQESRPAAGRVDA
jgi:hypothetical protein